MTSPEMRQRIKWFRDSSPYIHAHRHRRFVLYLGGDALADANLSNIISDITLLNSLGVKLVIVHGASPQLSAELERRNVASQFVQGNRVTDSLAMDCLMQITGKLHIELEAAFSTGLINSPMHGADVLISSGNFIKARPLGTLAGVDHQYSGEVRKIHAHMIDDQLNRGAIVLISPVGYSPSGEIFNLNAGNLAMRVATDLKADKLIYFCGQAGVLDKSGEVISEVQPSDLGNLEETGQTADISEILKTAVYACQKGVSRCHLISYSIDGALLEELFTRDGAGTQVCRESYEQIRRATIEDVNGIINLIRPLEDRGVLVRRSRELLETEIARFTVIIRDSAVVGCAALYPFGKQGELACLVTDPEYRNSERGDLLLHTIEKQAFEMRIETLFVLTTQSGHWFMERGFGKSSTEQLPMAKQDLYNYRRNSSILSKKIF